MKNKLKKVYNRNKSQIINKNRIFHKINNHNNNNNNKINYYNNNNNNNPNLSH